MSQQRSERHDWHWRAERCQLRDWLASQRVFWVR